MRFWKKGCALFLSAVLCSSVFLQQGIAVAAEKGEPIWGTSPIEEPYNYVLSGGFSGEEQPYSPDPLVSYRWDDPQVEDKLEIFLRRPESATTETPESFSGVESLTGDTVNVKVTGEGTILLDFGTEFAGWLEIDSPNLNGTVTLGISEYNEPAFVNVGAQSPNKTAVPKKYGDTYRLELNNELYEGVRFAFINVTDFDQPFDITGIRLVCQTKPVNYEGSFDSDNEMLNRIWYTAAYDVRVNLREDYFAAILMDRGDRYSWTGDAYPSQAASLVAFGNFDAVLQNLRYTSQHSNGIEIYELYWILSVIDYYEYTGDKDGVRELLSEVIKRLDHAYNIYGTNPSLGYVGSDERLGATFENPNLPENQNIYKMNCIRVWKEFAPVLDDLGLSEEAKKYLSYAEEKAAELLADSEWQQSFGIHAVADTINAGVLDETTTEKLFEKHFTNRVNRLSHSPFNQYFLLQAMGKAGEYESAVSTIFDIWGGQIEYGATTFFENYRPQWNDIIATNGPVPNSQSGYTSLAHPWGAGVLTWMSEELLGIKADSPGFETFTVKPHLTSATTRIKGKTPTGFGIIEAAIDVEAGTGSLTVPTGTTACFAVPKACRSVSDIRMNGEAASIASEDEEYYYIAGLTEGTYLFTMQYQGEGPVAEQLEYEYPARFIGQDTETQGSWGGVYGSEGYVLCSYGPGDVQVLPDYVSSVTTNKAQKAQWTASTDDERALSSNPLNIGDRSIGTWYTMDPYTCMQTFTVDIKLKEDRPYTVALYFVDWDSKGREAVVEMFDEETLNMVAPVQVVDDYEGGKYLIYEYNKSTRFRINQMRGDNATMSGIFFGEGNPEGPITVTSKIDDNDASILYEGSGWTRGPMPGTYLDTFIHSSIPGASATYSFEGTGITFIASREFNRGIAEIFVDGVSQGEIDLYSAVAQRQQEVFSIDGLEDGKHTFRMEVTGKQNPSAAGCYIDVDAFVVRRTVTIVDPPVPGSANKAILNKVINYAKAAKETEEYINVIASVKKSFDTAYATAQSVYGNPESTQSEVDSAWTVLMKEIHKLGFQMGDKTKLQADYDIYSQWNLDKYEDGAEKEAFVRAIAKADEVLKDADAMAGEINAADDALIAAADALIEIAKADKTSLQTIVDKASTCEKENYVTAGWSEFEAALSAAQAVLDKTDATQQEINESGSALVDAMMKLRFKADKSILDKLVNSAKNMDVSAYTAASVELFKKALNDAEALNVNESLTNEDQSMVDDSVNALTKAINGLVRTDGGANNITVNGDGTISQTGSSAKTGESIPIAAAVAVLVLAGAAFAGTKKRKK